MPHVREVARREAKVAGSRVGHPGMIAAVTGALKRG
jgi:hypothetical protein